MNPELIKHYFEVDKHYTYPKFPGGIVALTRVVGEPIFAV